MKNSKFDKISIVWTLNQQHYLIIMIIKQAVNQTQSNNTEMSFPDSVQELSSNY